MKAQSFEYRLQHTIAPMPDIAVQLRAKSAALAEFERLFVQEDQAPSGPAQSDGITCRAKAADDFRKKEWLWEIILVTATTILGGTIVLFLLEVLAVVNVQLTLVRACSAAGLMALNGGLLYLCRDHLFRLRNTANANLTSLAEAEALRHIQQLAVSGCGAEIINTVTQSAVALTRGAPMVAGTTNQTLMLARMERAAAPRLPETNFSSVALLQQLLDSALKQSQPHNDSEVKVSKPEGEKCA